MLVLGLEGPPEKSPPPHTCCALAKGSECTEGIQDGLQTYVVVQENCRQAVDVPVLHTTTAQSADTTKHFFMLPARASHLWSPPTRVTERELILARFLLCNKSKRLGSDFFGLQLDYRTVLLPAVRSGGSRQAEFPISFREAFALVTPYHMPAFGDFGRDELLDFFCAFRRACERIEARFG